MQDTEMTIEVRFIQDWRWRLGLWVMRLGVRLMRSRLKVVESQG